MTPTRIQKLFTYHQWAWRYVFASLKQVDEATYKEERPFFWGSMHGMVVHSLTADTIWLRRCQGHTPTQLLNPADFPDLTAVINQFTGVWNEWKTLLQSYSADDYGRIIHYTTTEGTAKQARLIDIIQHMINHGTEHRSQLTPVLYQLGHPTPELDYIYFCLEQD